MVRTTDAPASKLKPSKSTEESKSSPNPSAKRIKKPDDDPPSSLDPEPEDPKLSQLSQLDFDIHSKERTLALLTPKLPIDSQLTAQLADRDKYIDRLNTKILELEGKVQSAELTTLAQKEKQVKQLQRERVELTKQVGAFEERVLRAEGETADIRKVWEREKGDLEMLNEGLTEEAEALKTQMKIKEESLQSAKHDVLEMSRIVKELSTLNSEFNEKVLNMNKDVEKKNVDLFTAQSKAKQVEEMEKDLILAKTENQKLKRRAAKVTQMKANLVAIEDVLKTTRESLKSLEMNLAQIAHADIQAVLESVQKLRTAIGKNVADRTVADDPVLLQDEIRDLKASLAEKTIEAEKLIAVQSTFTDRITELEHEKETIKSDLILSNEKLKKRVKTYQESLEKFKSKCDQFESLYTQSETNYQKAQTQLISLQSQLSILKSKRNLEITTESQYESTIRELKSQLSSLKSQKLTSELSINNRESVLRAHAMQLKLLQDQIWKKDTELIRGCKQFPEDISAKKVTHREAEAMMKVKSAADLTSASNEIEGKDREIQMLKDLLKSTNQQLKAKEQELARAKKKQESLPEAVSSSPAGGDLGPLFAILQEYDEAQLLVERVEVEPKLPKQAIRSVLKSATVPEQKIEVVNLLQRKLREVYERLEAFCKKKPQTNVVLKSNILLNSAKLRDIAQVPDLTLQQLSARLTPQ